MATRYEYDVVKLKVEHDAHDRRCFRWSSCRGGCHDMDYGDLEEMLNHLGQKGWCVITHDTDAAYGSVMILRREIEDAAPTGKRSRTVVVTDPKAVEAVDAVKGEIAAMREALLAPREPAPGLAITDPALIAAIRGMAEEVREAAQSPPAPAVATLDAEARALLAALVEKPAPAPVFSPVVQAVVDREALAELKEALEQRPATAATAVLDEGAVRLLEAALARRDEPPPPAGPALAVLGEEAVAQLARVLEGATSRALAALPAPVVEVAPAVDLAPLLQLRAAAEADTLARLEDLLRCALARPAQPVVAELSESAEARLAALLSRLPAPRVTTVLDAASVAVLQRALLDAAASLAPPAPVALPTELSAEAVSQLVTAMERVLQRIPQSAAAPARATIDEASIQRLEGAITRAVAEILATKEEPEARPVVHPSLWSRLVTRLRPVFG